MQIICSRCENKIGEYNHPIKGETVSRKTLKKDKLPTVCPAQRKVLGKPVTLDGVDPDIYEVRMKKIVPCESRLTSFLVKNGKIYGI